MNSDKTKVKKAMKRETIGATGRDVEQGWAIL